MLKFIVRLSLVVVGLAAVGLQAAPERPGPRVDARLISEVSAVRAGTPFDVALVQEITPGWHTYWRNPGDSGAPTEIVWHLPPGFSAGEIQWPWPERIPYGPLVNFGYHDRVVLPVQITPPDTLEGDRIVLRAEARYLVCADICIPEDASLELVLPVTGASPPVDPDNAALFASARQKIPRDIGVDANYHVEGETVTLHVKLPGLKRERVEGATWFPFEDSVIDNAHPQQFSMVDDGFVITTKTGYEFEPGKSAFDGIVVVNEDSGETLSSAFEVHPRASAAAAPGGGLHVSMLTAVLFAFVGGLILNLMPCVFPVLSIKVLSLVGHADSKAVRLHGWLYVFGVVLSFLVVAGVLIGLRAAGAQIGWGFQLQSPLVIGLLVYLFFLIGLMLSGYFEIGFSVMNLGTSLSAGRGYTGSFLTGVLATVVAAPCTAPFMGAAIGFALTQDASRALAIFGSLGVGMGLPYLVLCYSPLLLKRLPRPGPWMETFKEFLAFPMYASAVWLIWVLSQQSGSTGVLLVLSGLIAIGFAIWLMKRTSRSLPARVVTGAVAVLLVLGALTLPGIVERPSAVSATEVASSEPLEESEDVLDSQPWSPRRLAEARKQGPVFVNFTAAWCITCKVNESVALTSDRVRQAFEEAGVTYLKGDWTNEDARITAALAEYGRSGVPLYLLYPQGEGRARVLPQILTESVVIEAVQSVTP